MHAILFAPAQEGRYDRQELIPWWDQERLARATVLVAGAGALGNETLKLLALLGVGHLQVVDFDVVSPSNLARMLLFRQADIGRPKAQAAAERLGEINPEVEVRAIQGDLGYDVGLGDYRKADLVLGCLDSVNARWALNRKCMQAGVAWIDAGISDFHGQVARYSPQGGACYECTFTGTTYERFNRRYACPYGLLSRQPERKVPTTAVMASLIAALQVQEALIALHGLPQGGLEPGQRLTLTLNPYHLTVDRLPANPDCLAHDPLPAAVPSLEIDWPGTTVAEAIRRARECLPGAEVLELPYELVAGFTCPACQQREEALRPKGRVYQDEARCPHCGELRLPEMIASISLDSPLARRRLQDLGLPPHEILAFASDRSRSFMELVPLSHE